MIRELKGWHVLAMLLGFFGVTIAVNIALSVYAIGTFSGEDVARPYMEGLAYNRTLEARAAQAALGWRATIGAGKADGGTAISVHIQDREGTAKSTLTVEALLRRPTTAGLDRTIALAAEGEGTYRAVAQGLAPGAWDIVIHAKSADDVFEATRRVVLP